MKKKLFVVFILLISVFVFIHDVKADGISVDERVDVVANQVATTIINGKTISWHYGVYTDGKYMS